MEKEIYQKEFSIGEMLSESWRLFVKNIKVFLKLTLCFYLPTSIVLYFISYINMGVTEKLEQGYTLSTGEITLFIITIIINLLVSIFSTLAMFMATFITKDSIDKKPIESLKFYYKKSLSKFIPFLWTSFILGLALMGSFLLFIIPAIIFGVYWVFVTQSIVLKDKKYTSAMTYSKNIVKGKWWRVFGYCIVFGIIGIVVGIVLLPVSIISQFSMMIPFVGFIFGAIGNTVMQFVYIFFIVLSVVFFINFNATKLKPEKKEKKEIAEKAEELKTEKSLT